jgi:putative transposase
VKITYKYRLKPTTAQIATFSSWLELCRRQYNFRLGQRFDWYEATRSRVDACPLVASIVSLEEAFKHIPLTRTLVKGKRKGEEVSNILEKGYVDW